MMKKKTLAIIICLAALVGLMAFGFAGCSAVQSKLGGSANPTATAAPTTSAPTLVTAEGKITPNQSAALSFMLSGQVSDVLVKVGDMVKSGDVLVKIGDTAGLQANLSAANFELFNAQQALSDLIKNSALVTDQNAANVLLVERDLIKAKQALTDLNTKEYQTQIDNARQKVLDTQKTLNDRQADFDKVKDFTKDNPAYKTADQALKDAQKAYDDAVYARDQLINELNLAQINVTLTQARYEDAQRKADATKNGPDPDIQAQLKQRVDNAKAQVGAAQAALEHANLKAPFDGTILEVDIKTGEIAVPGQPIIIVADLSQWYVETTDLTEKEVVKITTGQDVRVVPDALSDLNLRGQVESIDQVAGSRAGDVTYTVRIKLTDTDARLRWGMTVEARFQP